MVPVVRVSWDISPQVVVSGSEPMCLGMFRGVPSDVILRPFIFVIFAWIAVIQIIWRAPPGHPDHLKGPSWSSTPWGTSSPWTSSSGRAVSSMGTRLVRVFFVSRIIRISCYVILSGGTFLHHLMEDCRSSTFTIKIMNNIHVLSRQIFWAIQHSQSKSAPPCFCTCRCFSSNVKDIIFSFGGNWYSLGRLSLDLNCWHFTQAACPAGVAPDIVNVECFQHLIDCCSLLLSGIPGLTIWPFGPIM